MQDTLDSLGKISVELRSVIVKMIKPAEATYIKTKKKSCSSVSEAVSSRVLFHPLLSLEYFHLLPLGIKMQLICHPQNPLA